MAAWAPPPPVLGDGRRLLRNERQVLGQVIPHDLRDAWRDALAGWCERTQAELASQGGDAQPVALLIEARPGGRLAPEDVHRLQSEVAAALGWQQVGAADVQQLLELPAGELAEVVSAAGGRLQGRQRQQEQPLAPEAGAAHAWAELPLRVPVAAAEAFTLPLDDPRPRLRGQQGLRATRQLQPGSFVGFYDAICCSAHEWAWRCETPPGSGVWPSSAAEWRLASELYAHRADSEGGEEDGEPAGTAAPPSSLVFSAHGCANATALAADPLIDPVAGLLASGGRSAGAAAPAAGGGGGTLRANVEIRLLHIFGWCFPALVATADVAAGEELLLLRGTAHWLAVADALRDVAAQQYTQVLHSMIDTLANSAATEAASGAGALQASAQQQQQQQQQQAEQGQQQDLELDFEADDEAAQLEQGGSDADAAGADADGPPEVEQQEQNDRGRDAPRPQRRGRSARESEREREPPPLLQLLLAVLGAGPGSLKAAEALAGCSSAVLARAVEAAAQAAPPLLRSHPELVRLALCPSGKQLGLLVEARRRLLQQQEQQERPSSSRSQQRQAHRRRRAQQQEAANDTAGQQQEAEDEEGQEPSALAGELEQLQEQQEQQQATLSQARDLLEAGLQLLAQTLAGPEAGEAVQATAQQQRATSRRQSQADRQQAAKAARQAAPAAPAGNKRQAGGSRKRPDKRRRRDYKQSAFDDELPDGVSPLGLPIGPSTQQPQLPQPPLQQQEQPAAPAVEPPHSHGQQAQPAGFEPQGQGQQQQQQQQQEGQPDYDRAFQEHMQRLQQLHMRHRDRQGGPGRGGPPMRQPPPAMPPQLPLPGQPQFGAGPQGLPGMGAAWQQPPRQLEQPRLGAPGFAAASTGGAAAAQPPRGPELGSRPAAARQDAATAVPPLPPPAPVAASPRAPSGGGRERERERRRSRERSGSGRARSRSRSPRERDGRRSGSRDRSRDKKRDRGGRERERARSRSPRWRSRGGEAAAPRQGRSRSPGAPR